MKNHRIILIVLSLAVLLTLLFAAQLGVSAAETGLPVEQEDVLAQEQPDGVVSGTCGMSLNWVYDAGTEVLTITGTGDMYDYTPSTSPWYWSRSFKKVVIGEGVTSIGNYAFNICNEFSSIVIPKSLRRIGNSAFSYCSALTTVELPSAVTSIGESAFAFCDSLTSITVAAGNANYCSVNGVLFNKSKTELIQYPARKTAESYSIPDSVTSIGFGAFISSEALKSVTIPSSVKDMGAYAFGLCTSLESIVIPSSITIIGTGTFSSCTSLKSVTIPGSVKVIESCAFEDCTELKDVYYRGTNAEWLKVSIYDYNDPLFDATMHFASNLNSVTGLGQSNHGSDFISLSWNSVEGATGYYVYRIMGSEWKNIANTTTNSAKITKLAPGASYKFRVRAYAGSVTGGYSDVVSAHTGPSAMTGKVSVNRQDSEMIRLQWDKINNADGYMIYWYVNGKLTKLSATLNTAYSITKLNSDTKYTFKVRGYRKVGNGIYVGGYSADFATWTGPKPTTGSAVAKTKSATLRWDAVKGATKYYIYVYTEATGYYTCVCSTTATSKTITGLKSGQAYYYRVKACKVNGGVNYYSSYSNVMFARAK